MIDCLWPNSQQNEAENQNNGTSSNGEHHENEDNAGNDDDDNEEFIDCDEESAITEFWVRIFIFSDFNAAINVIKFLDGSR